MKQSFESPQDCGYFPSFAVDGEKRVYLVYKKRGIRIFDKNGKLLYDQKPFEDSEDGISFTFAITPSTLGQDEETKVSNLVSMLDGYFAETGHHINVNVFNRALLEDAMEHPEKYPQLTIRVSGYAVHFTKLTREQQLDVINRTIHERI